MFEDQIRQTEGYLELPDKETGEAPESRIADAQSVRTIHRKLLKDDEDRSYNRGLVRQMLNGTPPFATVARAEDGQNELFNVNTGRGRMIVDEATSGLMDMFDPGKLLANIPLSRRIPTSQRFVYEKAINRRFTNMVRSWDAFIPRMTNHCFTCAADGVGTVFFEDDLSWKFNSASLAEVKFLEHCEPVSDAIPFASIEKGVHVGELYSWVRDEKVAEESGWDRKAVFRAIHDSAKERNREWDNWEKLEEDLKANELYVSSVADPVPIIYAWVKEFDGTVSSFIVANTGEKEFLKKAIGNYENANQAFQVFPYSTGTNNRLYTIRGIGYFVYQPANAENMMWSTLMNAATFESLKTYQVRDSAELEDAFLQDISMGTILGPGVALAENQTQRNLGNSLVPALNLIDSTLARTTGGLSEGPQAFGERANESSINYALETMNKMNAFAIQLFYPPLDRVWAEVVRRVFKEDLDTPESLEMKRILVEEDGVPEDVFKMISWNEVAAVRIIGGGSKAKRINNLLQVRRELYPSMDAQGRKESDFDLACERMGYQYAERYIGNVDQTRKPLDSKIAQLENYELSDGGELDPEDGEDHLTHLYEHIEFMLAGNEAVESGQVDVMDYAVQNIKVWEHAQSHLGMLVVDRTLEEEAAEIRAQMQRIGEHIGNGMRRLQKEQRQAPQQAEGEPNQEALLEEQMKQASWEREEQRKDLSTQAEIQRKDAKTAAEIAASTAKKVTS